MLKTINGKEENVWSLEEIIEELDKHIKYHFYGYIQLNFNRGEVLNINVFQSKKPIRKNGTETKEEK